MSAYPSSVHRTASPASWIILLVAVAAAYLIPGIFGHGPWKQDETYSFGIIYNMITTGDYLVPTNAGIHFMEKPPLYYWTAAITAQLLSPILPYHDGARFASLLYMAITLVFITKIVRAGWQETTVFTPRVLATLALFAGTAGMLKHAHDMFTDVSLVCGSAIALYGLLRIVQNLENGAPLKMDAFWFGLGSGMAFLSKGLLVPGVYGITVFVLPFLFHQCRSLAYVRLIALAALVAVPFATIWPALLYQHSFPLFMKWFWDNNFGRFFGFSVAELGAANVDGLGWRAPFEFLIPTTPLVILALVTGMWRQIRQPVIGITLVFSVIMTAILVTSASARHLYYLPLALPFALLSIPALERLPARVHTIWDWFSRCVFGLVIAVLWFAFIVSTLPVEHHHLVKFLGKHVPLDYVSTIAPLSLIAALAMTIGWLISLPRLKQYPQWRGAFSWFGGITVMWGILATVLLPWIDTAKSYEYVYTELADKIRPEWQDGDCMASFRLGESESPTLLYYAGILHTPLEFKGEEAKQCRWLIIQQQFNLPTQVARQEHELAIKKLLTPEWVPFWEGRRANDHVQLLRVFKRAEVATP